MLFSEQQHNCGATATAKQKAIVKQLLRLASRDALVFNRVGTFQLIFLFRFLMLKFNAAC